MSDTTDQIKNTVTVSYEYNEEEFEETEDCFLDKKDPTQPDIHITKVGAPQEVGIGDTITYNLTIVIGDGDDFYEETLVADVIDESTDFVVGTLYINGVLAENQDLSDIDVELTPNTVYNITYQCIRTRL